MSWEYLKVSDFAEVITGGTPSTAIKEYWENGNIPWLNSGELNQDIVTTSDNFITVTGLENSAAKIMPKDTVLIALTGATTGVVGYLTFEACANQSVTGILPSSKHHPKYLYYYLKSIREKVLNESYGGAQKHISQGYVKELRIPLPPLPVQKRIAEILDAADALRRKDQELLNKYDELAQAIFIDMFGDPVKNEKGWEKVRMSDLMTIVRGGSPRPIDKYLGGNIPWIKIGDATKGDDVYLNETKEHIIEDGLGKTRLLPAGSLIFANCGVSLGFARIITFEGCIHDGWLAFSNIDNERLNKIFLLKALNSVTKYFRDSAPEGTQPNLNTGIMKDFKLILPPKILQDEFECSIECISSSVTKTKSVVESSNALFLSLLEEAFKGELC